MELMIIAASDLFVCCLSTRDLFVVEVKDWSGSVHLNSDGSWLQTRENGSIAVHPNVVMSSDPWLVFQSMYCHILMIIFRDYWFHQVFAV